MLKITYEQTAKAGALSRLVGALRQEARALEKACASIFGCDGRAQKRHLTIAAEIAFLEEINNEWRERHEKEIARQQAAEIPDDQGWHGYPPALAKFLREATEAEKREARGEFRLITQALQEEQAHQETTGGGQSEGDAGDVAERIEREGEGSQPTAKRVGSDGKNKEPQP